MYRKPSKKQLLIQRSIVVAVMFISIVVIVTGTILFILGYRLDGIDGRLEQNALVQFDSRPNGAAVNIDGAPSGVQTAGKRSVMAGERTFRMTRDGYRPWQRTLTLQPGTLTWLDYARLVPNNVQTQSVRTYESVAGMKAAPDYQTIVVQPRADVPSFDIVDIRSPEVKAASVQLPADVLSGTTTEGTTHAYEMVRWDKGGRYLLVKHTDGDAQEWILFDTDNVSESVNISRLFSIPLSDVQFAGTNGTLLYGLSDGVVRKLDIGNATISRGLVSNVTSFNMYETSLFTYVATDPATPGKRVAGLYRDGDRDPYIIRAVNDETTPLMIYTARHQNNDYITVLEGQEVTVLKGRYPTGTDSLDRYMNVATTFSTESPVDQMMISPGGDYVLARSGRSLQSYEVEYDRLTMSTLQSSESTVRPLSWLTDAQLTNTVDGRLTMRDFDGTNVQDIMAIDSNFEVTLSQNGRYIYGITQSNGTSRLERAVMIMQE